jgi:PTS system nitrogen regulatory IIA component
MKIDKLFRPDRMLAGLSARTKRELLKALCNRAGEELGLDPNMLLSRLLSREALGSTGTGGGIAMPHASLTEIDAPFILLASLSQPVNFEAIDDAAVDVVCLLFNPPEKNTEKLTCLAAISRQLRNPIVQQMIRRARSQDELYAAAIYTEAE